MDLIRHTIPIGQQLDQIQLRDHLAIIYQDPNAWKKSVVPVMLSGLERNERCIYIIKEETEAEIREYCSQLGYDLKSFEDSGAFMFLTNKESYMLNNEFDVPTTIQFLLNYMQAALKDGFIGLRVTGDLSHSSDTEEGLRKILEYEAKTNEIIFSKYPLIAICRYNLKKYNNQFIKQVINLHPYIIWEGQIHENPYYMPPAIFGADAETKKEVLKWLENLNVFMKKEGRFLRYSKDQTAEFQTLFHNISHPIFVTEWGEADIPGRITEINQEASQVLGYTKSEFLEMAFYDLFEGDSLLAMDGSAININDRLQDHGEAVYEGVLLTKKKKKISVEVNSHICTLWGRAMVLTITHDITERREEQNRLKENYAQLEARLEYEKLKNEFFLSLSHEFRTPLNLMFAALQLLETKTRDDPKLQRYLKILRQNNYRLIKLVNNLLDITKMKSGTFNLNLQNLDIVDLVRKVTGSVEEYVQEQDKVIMFNSNVEAKLMAIDPESIERIILNLLSNAVKSTKAGDQIEVNVNDQGDHVAISIEDTGSGIPEDKINVIFEQFRRVEDSFIRTHEGSGLGLWIVKSLVELHNGQIILNSKFGEGSEFIVILPVVQLTKNIQEEKTTQSLIDRLEVEFSDIYDL